MINLFLPKNTAGSNISMDLTAIMTLADSIPSIFFTKLQKKTFLTAKDKQKQTVKCPRG